MNELEMCLFELKTIVNAELEIRRRVKEETRKLHDDLINDAYERAKEDMEYDFLENIELEEIIGVINRRYYSVEDIFSPDTIVEYVQDNYAVDYVFTENDIKDYITNNWYIEDLVEWRY